MSIYTFDGVSDEEVTRYVFREHEPEPADIAIVDGEHALPSVLDYRAKQAISLFERGFVSRFLCVGERFPGGKRETGSSGGTYLKKRMVAAGVPSRNILTCCEMTLSYGYLLTQLRERGRIGEIKTVIIVTCPFNTGWIVLTRVSSLDDGTKVLVCPHHEAGTADSWANSEHWRRFVWLRYRMMKEAELRRSQHS
jgi:hypothetical protein